MFLNNNRTAMLMPFERARAFGFKESTKIEMWHERKFFLILRTVYISVRHGTRREWVRESYSILSGGGGMELYTWIIFTWAYRERIEPLRSFRQSLFIHFRAGEGPTRSGTRAVRSCATSICGSSAWERADGCVMGGRTRQFDPSSLYRDSFQFPSDKLSRIVFFFFYFSNEWNFPRFHFVFLIES